jgi:serine kinase of HPr protein (carbohydrate metabolism regulator)
VRGARHRLVADDLVDVSREMRFFLNVRNPEDPWHQFTMGVYQSSTIRCMVYVWCRYGVATITVPVHKEIKLLYDMVKW